MKLWPSVLYTVLSTMVIRRIAWTTMPRLNEAWTAFERTTSPGAYQPAWKCKGYLPFVMRCPMFVNSTPHTVPWFVWLIMKWPHFCVAVHAASPRTTMLRERGATSLAITHIGSDASHPRCACLRPAASVTVRP